MSFDSPSHTPQTSPPGEQADIADPDRRRRRRRRDRTRRPLALSVSPVEVLLTVVVIGSVLGIGSVHRPALFVISALALVGGALSVAALQKVPVPAVVLAALGLFSALQSLPMPAGWALRLSPASAQVWLRCLAPFGENELTRFPISLDPGASIAEALKWLTYASVYVMAVHVRSRRKASWLGTLLFGSACLVALLTIAHGVGDVRSLYGIYEPNFPIGRWNVGPLLNSNNLAGYATLGLFAGAGLLLSGRSAIPRLALSSGLATICTALLLSGSRAGVLSALISSAVVVASILRRPRSLPSIRKLMIAAAPLLLGVAGAVAFGSRKDATQLMSLDARRKIAVWEWSLPMIREHVWFGVGRGAFETAFPPYRHAFEHDWAGVFSHAENFVVQWLAEWGLPVGVCASVAVIAYVAREWYRARADRLRFVLLAGLAALLVQNLADLGLEVPAVVIAAVVALAAGESASSRRPEPRSLAPTLVLAVPCFALWAAALIWSGQSVEVERRQVSAQYRELARNKGSELVYASFNEALHGAMLRHPGEAFFPLLGSAASYRAGDGRALVWIGRALELGPTNGHVHFVLAQFFAAHKATSQAMLHLRLAVENDTTLTSVAAARAAQWAPSIDLLLEAIPSSRVGAEMLATACAKTRPELKPDCFRKTVARSPREPSAFEHLADSLLVALRTGQPPCAGAAFAESCAQEVDRTARAIGKLDPTSWRSGYVMARVMLLRGDAQGAAKLLARVCPGGIEGRDCSRESVRAALKSGSEEALRTASDRYAARDCGNDASCAEAWDWLGTTLEGAGKAGPAVNAYTKAAEIDGSAARWLRVADRAARAGLSGVAKLALQRADHSPDASENSRAHAQQLRNRLARSMNDTL